MSLFKTKEQRQLDKKRKELKNQIAAIGTGGGRGNQATKKRLQRELTNLNTPKKEEKKTSGLSGAQANKRKNYGNHQTGGGGGSTTSGSSSNKTKTNSNLITYKGKKVLKTSALGKKAIHEQKKKALASKNYMTKEMIEKRKKRLKIK